MRVYYPVSGKSHTLFVTPAVDAKGVVLDGASQWKEENGSPIMYRVAFVNGCAEVPAELGQWLIKLGYANRTRLIVPGPKRIGA